MFDSSVHQEIVGIDNNDVNSSDFIMYVLHVRTCIQEMIDTSTCIQKNTTT